MKKTLLILAVALLGLSACSKGEDYRGELGGHKNYMASAGGNYMMLLADDLVATALMDLETALELGRAPGTVYWGSPLHGMRIEDAGTEGWLLSFTDDLELAGCTYPTEFILFAKAEPEWTEGQRHGGWDVRLKGTRTERENFSCSFESMGTLNYRVYQADDTYHVDQTGTMGWNLIYGSISMVVYVSGETKDICLLRFSGNPSAAQFVHGL